MTRLRLTLDTDYGTREVEVNIPQRILDRMKNEYGVEFRPDQYVTDDKNQPGADNVTGRDVHGQ